ncbi:MAG: type II toxin-antitoxin system RelE/ParE family toxin [Gammaproteobacteria bacterium]|nr:type II toxin-antitoxin system RelE/ParE family toxin [Gammaproteobacteria bacterium]
MGNSINMPLYVLTEQSKQDLIQIRRFTVERWGNEQSINYLGELKKTLRLLSEMPAMGKSCFDDLGKSSYRFPCGSHVIYYLTMPNNKIVIVAILHQSRVPEPHLEGRFKTSTSSPTS